ncbi:RPA-interacting protein, putative [Pediculus humanus corporis]|uniref:RPA-interacting protein, putative n=1 Tax=Pediculus humanus subsp. corporis TaxID=121224 RepID=E0VQ01_PEDHC|nr:RPA-interacting protein, putative [Pediculus humanus corporis]EEB15457.1 RPA-interacting protein, putative [Pediculus humanus corporis]
MSNNIITSPRNSIEKTRRAILRMRNCSPELKDVLRQRCQERIRNERFKILNNVRKIAMKENFKVAFGNIIREEWENIDDNEPVKTPNSKLKSTDFNLDEELKLEEILEKELLEEHEEWLINQYEELIKCDLDSTNSVVCPLCCLGYLKIANGFDIDNKKIGCSKCSETFTINQKSLLHLQSAIYECLSWHDKQCLSFPCFVNVPKNDYESNLCVICDNCSFLNVVM